MRRIPILWLSAAWLASCATVPSGPSVLVLPGTGKSDGQFHGDDAGCRASAHAQVATAPVKPGSLEEGQQLYDIGYIQCMYGKGHRVPVPGNLLYDTREDWHPPPSPTMPPPPGNAPPENPGTGTP